jgi:16S rRNA (guanine527-N7)-methyltransferase
MMDNSHLFTSLAQLGTKNSPEKIKHSPCTLIYNALSMADEIPGSLKPDIIADLLAPFVGPTHLMDSTVRAIGVYIDLLLRWNAKLNLTAIRDPQEIITRHFGESLFAAKLLFPADDSHASVLDVGSGAGFPGVPIKLWCRSLDLILIDSNQRKATFLREVIRTLDLKSAVVLNERAETVSIRADLVTLRAVERFDRILPAASGLVRPGGRIALLLGEAQLGAAQAALPSLTWHEPLPIPLTRNGRLLVGETKV